MNHGIGPLQLDPEGVLLFHKGVEEFNAGRFFECHETLEDLWHGVRGEARDFFQGLIQVAVGLYHLDNGNLRGSRSQLEKGLRRLQGYASPYLGIALDEFRRQATTWLERVLRDEEIQGHVRDLPKLRFISTPS